MMTQNTTMKLTVRNKDGGFVQFLRSHKAMAFIIFTVACIALYLVKSSLGAVWKPSLAVIDGLVVLGNKNTMNYFKTNDATNITWAHGVNNAKFLQLALRTGKAMMLEADVQIDSKGTLIMAHPPAVTSDLTLDAFLRETIATTKGVKLDFKSMEAAEAGLKLVGANYQKATDRIWLNADIVQGSNAPMTLIDADKFLTLAKLHCPNFQLSVGWSLGQPSSNYKGGYDRLMVEKMHKVLDRNKINQAVTFAVEATYAVLAVDQLDWLLANTPQSSLTLWFHHLSQATLRDLICLRERFGKGKVYMDMPIEMRKVYDNDHQVTCKMP